MTDRVPVPKKELQRFHVQVPLPSRKRRGRKLVIRLLRRERESGRVEEEENFTSHSLARLPKRSKVSGVWRWLLLWLSVLAILGGSLASGILLLTKLPPPINCQRISPLSADGDRLYCAQAAVESGKLERIEAALTLLQHWPSNHPLYSEAQRVMKEASAAILELAQQKNSQGDQTGAIQLIGKIPVTSPLYQETRATVTTWQQQWQRGEEITKQFKDALKVQNWYQASQLLLELPKLNSQYWNVSRVDVLIQQLEAEKQAWQQFQEARDLAKSNRLEQLYEAIALASKIDPNSYIKAQAQVELSKWSRTLLQIAASLFENRNYAGAVGILERIPVNTSNYQEAQDWIHLSRATEAAQKDNVFALVDALETVRQINPKSPVRQKATAQAALWQSKLQDRMQLQFAQLLASVGQQTGHEMAIDQATRVAPGRPQRLFAQTLIAQWRKEIQHIEDRKNLMEAQQLAAG
ncbi:MAG: hypothetical protein LDL41_20695, partial [Coleofasciculus sp. S288]|nr:hypothetical protein [Coleofasciculus sp. S288]